MKKKQMKITSLKKQLKTAEDELTRKEVIINYLEMR